MIFQVSRLQCKDPVAALNKLSPDLVNAQTCKCSMKPELARSDTSAMGGRHGCQQLSWYLSAWSPMAQWGGARTFMTAVWQLALRHSLLKKSMLQSTHLKWSKKSRCYKCCVGFAIGLWFVLLMFFNQYMSLLYNPWQSTQQIVLKKIWNLSLSFPPSYHPQAHEGKMLTFLWGNREDKVGRDETEAWPDGLWHLGEILRTVACLLETITGTVN